MPSTKVIVFGATGAIGTALIEILSKQHPDWNILAVSTKASADNGGNHSSRLASLQLPNVKIVQGNSFDKENVLTLSRPCDIIFSCIGFRQYERGYWAKHWPLTVDNLLAAVAQDPSKKKRLVFCDNIYAYGPGQDISPRTAPVEASLKGKPNIRALIRQTFVEHMTKHPGTLTVVGGADFFGPHVTDKSFLGDTVAGKIVAGERALAIGAVDKVHDFCFAPDFATALAVAADNDAAYDHFWICPHSIHGKTLQEIANDIAAQAEKPTPVRFTVLGPWMVRFLSPFMGFMAEMTEMLPFWTQDYTVDDSDFCKTFGTRATPYEEALKSLVEFYKQPKHTSS
jgi:nucleoside-diphosphate-sugar epimerase